MLGRVENEIGHKVPLCDRANLMLDCGMVERALPIGPPIFRTGCAQKPDRTAGPCGEKFQGGCNAENDSAGSDFVRSNTVGCG